MALDERRTRGVRYYGGHRHKRALTLLASILLIAPTVLHRLEFQRGEKPYVVRSANRLTIAGLSALAIAMTCAIALITHYLFGPATAATTTVVVVLAFGLIWFVPPLRHRRSAG